MMGGIYIHFPFCKSKCIYCNFYSIAAIHKKDIYLDALYQEIQNTTYYLPDCHISTIYFGGGTPSILTPSEVESLLSLLAKYYDIASDAEITFEANPEQLTPVYAKELNNIGINRLSMGIQSFSDEILSLLQRRHSSEEAVHALDAAFGAGFDNVSLDLIYGIPYRTDKQWKKELNLAFSFPIKHLSAYSLTVEPATLLYQRIKNNRFLPPDEDREETDYHILLNHAQIFGFEHYEVSNFAKPGHFSRHNFAYWEGLPYLGLGPSAHSFNGQSREWNPSDIERYAHNVQAGQRFEEREQLTPEMRFNEYVLLMLRTYKGIDIEHIKDTFGLIYAHRLKNNLSDMDGRFYYERTPGCYVLTEQGLRFADKMAVDLLI